MTRLEDLFTARTAVVIPDAIGSGPAAELRDRFERAGYTRYALVDRGSYDELREPGELETCAALIAIASEATERDLELAEARVLQLGPGDYLLAHHDRIHDEHHVELMLDLSSAAVPDASVHYRRHGNVTFRAPSRPCALSIVARESSVTCNHTYISKLHTGARVIRLVLLLRDR